MQNFPIDKQLFALLLDTVQELLVVILLKQTSNIGNITFHKILSITLLNCNKE